MSDAVSIVTSPLAVTTGLGADDLAVAVAADAIARRLRAAAGVDTTVYLPALAGDRASVLALERAGRPPSDLVAFEGARAAQADEQLAALDVQARVSDSALVAPVAEAATVAFVRLFEQGLIDATEMVVAVCPSCATVVEGADTEPGTVDADLLDIALPCDGDRDRDHGHGHVELVVRVVALELLGGATAVAVPQGHPAAGAHAALPLGGRRVPVIAAPDVVEPTLVVPAHSREGHDLAVVHRLGAPPVLGEDGVVVAGPLAGLGRYAARQASRELVEAEGTVRAVTGGEEPVERCRHCGSITVPVLGRHWALRGGRLEVAAADAVRDELVTFVPGDAREAFLGIALADRPWCLDRNAPPGAGVPLPVATCVDCGRASVSATPSSTCSACLGELRASEQTLDARFVAAFWPLAMAGWPRPSRSRSPSPPSPPAIAVVTPAAAATWLLPVLALARHLTGELPLGTVVVHPAPAESERDTETEVDDARAIRIALLAGDLSALDDVQAALDGLDRPTGDDDDADVPDAIEAAAAELDPGGAGPVQAAALLLAALGRGVRRGADAERVRAAAAPFLGGD